MRSQAWLVALFVVWVSGQPAVSSCSELACSAFTQSCESGVCECRPGFYGTLCTISFTEERRDLFFGLYSLSLVTAAIVTAFALFLIAYYFCRFIPKAKRHNQQILGLFMIALAAILRLINSIAYLALGPFVTRDYFFQGANFMQAVLRLSLALYYPLAAGALTLQVLIWIEFVVAVKSLKQTTSTWVPRFKWIFFPALIFLFLLIFILEMLLLANVENPLIYFIYRGLFGLYMVVLLVVCVIFAVRLHRILKQGTKLMAETKASNRAKASRKNLTRLVLVSCSFVALALLLSILYLAMPVSKNPNIYWPFFYCLRLAEMGLILSMLLTALGMMRNRIAYASSNEALEAEMDKVSTTALMGKKLKQKVGRRTASSHELQEPLMDYSGFGSVVDESEGGDDFSVTTSLTTTMSVSARGSIVMLDTEVDDARGYEYQAGELVWAQYRMDGLWYAARVDSLLGDEIGLEYLDYELSDTLPIEAVCPDYQALLTGERLNPIKAFDSRPTTSLLGRAGAVQPDSFGLVRLRGKSARKPNHSSLLLKRNK